MPLCEMWPLGGEGGLGSVTPGANKFFNPPGMYWAQPYQVSRDHTRSIWALSRWSPSLILDLIVGSGAESFTEISWQVNEPK